jgi:hypothetical protein
MAIPEMTHILTGLMTRYKTRVPNVQTIITAMIDSQLIKTMDDIVNDHIAFRTMGVPHLGIQSLEKIFLAHGYHKQNSYRFDHKKLNAYWYSPPSPDLNWPRIFISELCVNELPHAIQDIITSYTNTVTSDPVDAITLTDATQVDTFLHSPLWRTPTWDDYTALLSDSEYAAWVIYNRYYLNHFTISVHHLPDGYNTIDSFNRFLEKQGLLLNDSGGKIKVSRDGCLIQSATVSEKVMASFDDGHGKKIDQLIPGSYVEFAERRDGRDGFDSQNADKIFESTYRSQADKRSQ